MKIPAFLLLLCGVVTMTAQPKKYQSLLWEISGNGLEKKSYVYGSMHVSDKVSYHLSDAFFHHLLAADYVATESDPATWINLYGSMAARMDGKNTDAFYSGFYQQPLKREDLFPLFRNETYVSNNLLWRTSETQKDFQEDTYLDMFIYQTGRKYRKQVVGLEDAKTSMMSVVNAENDYPEPREENVQIITKLLRERSFNQALLDYYREKNLDMLDSLYALMTPEKYFKALILDRNQVMANSIDSLARKGSLFAAIGAAHLPGKAGVIELLREKGYKVNPVSSAYTDEGRSIKKQIDDFFIKPEFVATTTPDGLLSLPMLRQSIYHDEAIGTPDLANGGMVNVKRVLLRDYLRKDDSVFNPKSLDSLFYENIPGNIVQKKFETGDHYAMYDLSNTTKTGNAQRYRFYLTPLEIVTVSMNGNGDYVRRYEGEVFPKIKLKPYVDGWETISPAKAGFSIVAPAYFVVHGNRDADEPQDIEINAYDQQENAWYFLSEKTLSDNQTLEDSDFERRRIQQEFYAQHDMVPNGVASSTATGYVSEADFGSKHFRLKTIVNGQKYYLLGTVNASTSNSDRFFDSFIKLPTAPDPNTQTYVDYQGHFEIDLPEKPNEPLFWKIPGPEVRNLAPGTLPDLFETNDKQYRFFSPSGESADLYAWTCHRYDFVVNRDSLIANIRRNILEDYNSADFDDPSSGTVYAALGASLSQNPALPESRWDALLNEQYRRQLREQKTEIVGFRERFDLDRNAVVLELSAQKPISEQAVKYRIFLQDGYIWYLRALVDKTDADSGAFLESLAKSFVPRTNVPEFSLFDRKMAIFLSDVRSANDTIRYSAFQSLDQLRIEKEDLGLLGEFLLTSEFRADEIRPVSLLLERIGGMESTSVLPLLDAFYRRESVNPLLQLAVIRALCKQRSRVAYSKISELMEYDLPLSNNDSEISSLFSLFSKDLEHSKILYPILLQFYGVPEYHDPVVRFTTELFREKLVPPKKLKPFRKLLLTDARLEYKRVLGWISSRAAKGSPGNFSTATRISMLENYAELLYPFRKEKDVAQWLSRTASLDFATLQLDLLRLDLEHNVTIDEARLQKLLSQPSTRFAAYSLLRAHKKMPAQWNDQQIATAVAELALDKNAAPDGLAFQSVRKVAVGDLDAMIFFFVANKADINATSYNVTAPQLVASAFFLQKGQLDPGAWTVLDTRELGPDDDITRQCDLVADELANGRHLRATFRKQTNPASTYANYDY